MALNYAVLTLDLVDPNHPDGNRKAFITLDDEVSFQHMSYGNIRTLSTTGAKPGEDITGLLFVPEPAESQCNTAGYVSPNAVRKQDLPEKYSMIAFAPWINANCTLAFLNAVHNESFVSAFMFYLPKNGTGIPPAVNSPEWLLEDGGQWKSLFKFPVYAIPGQEGQMIMDQLGLYNGNVSSVPQGNMLSQSFPSTDYIRLVAQIDMGRTTSLPNLWVFLLIVLAILLFIISSTSCAMHCIQRRRRNELRRRVINGEVDLESLGIRRMTVPQEVVDRFPLFQYTTDPVPVSNPEPQNDGSPIVIEPAAHLTSRPISPEFDPKIPPRAPAFPQPTCPICLDDYASHETTVRELPCQHIFHPTCIDPFLLQNSSLCPMCKKTALPKGYCPERITNAMVRRERIASNRRENDVVEWRPSSRSGLNSLARFYGNLRNRPTPSQEHARLQSSGGDSAPPNNTSLSRFLNSFQRPPADPPSPVEMRSTGSAFPITSPAPAHTAASQQPADRVVPIDDIRTDSLARPPPPDQPHRRAEWLRHRAEALLNRGGGRPDAAGVAIPAVDDEDRRGGWRKVVGKVFPGFS